MSAGGEARAVFAGTGTAMIALWSGSAVLASRICRCTGRALGWAWEQASIDPVAQAAADAQAEKLAKARAKAVAKAAKNGAEPPEFEPVTLLSGRRPFLETLAFLALGGALAAGAIGTVNALVVPYLGLLSPWRPVIVSVGGLAWAIAAWMVAPPPAPADEEDQDQEDDGHQEQDSPEAAADRIMRHILLALADVEAAGGKGVHVRELVDTAVEAGLLAEDTDKIELRDWIAGNGLPVTKSVKLRNTVDFGVRVDRVTEALGMSPADAVRKLFPTDEFAPSGEGPPAPAQEASEGVGEGVPETVGETPVESPSAPPAQPPAGAPSGVLSGALSRLSLPARLGRLQAPPQ